METAKSRTDGGNIRCIHNNKYGARIPPWAAPDCTAVDIYYYILYRVRASSSPRLSLVTERHCRLQSRRRHRSRRAAWPSPVANARPRNDWPTVGDRGVVRDVIDFPSRSFFASLARSVSLALRFPFSVVPTYRARLFPRFIFLFFVYLLLFFFSPYSSIIFFLLLYIIFFAHARY